MISGTLGEVSYTGRIKRFPGGLIEYMACDSAVFRASGWEERGPERSRGKRDRGGEGDTARAVRRARTAVRDIALANPMGYFVTLTLDPARCNRYDIDDIVPRLNAWLSNQVQRRGLAYVLVPERHKDGAVHFHGFFNDALPLVDSGTISLPGARPRKPRSKAQRAEWIAQGGRVVYNIPGWSLGFSTAIGLYGEYSRAVGYVCKYVGKDMGGKIGGRWYYSGGALARPEVEYCDLDWRSLAEMPGAYEFTIDAAGTHFVVVRNF